MFLRLSNVSSISVKALIIHFISVIHKQRRKIDKPSNQKPQILYSLNNTIFHSELHEYSKNPQFQFNYNYSFVDEDLTFQAVLRSFKMLVSAIVNKNPSYVQSYIF